MPRKFITQEVKDQNRESQRRSRARRLELINDLKTQVQEYQRRGASASLEMQRLARAVARENQRLRSLLSERGVSQDEIQHYLSSSPSGQLLSTPDTLYSYDSGSFRCETCGSTSIVRDNQPAILMGRRPSSHPSPLKTHPEVPQSFSSTSPETIHSGNSADADAAAFTLPPGASTAIGDTRLGCGQAESKSQSGQHQESRLGQHGMSQSDASDAQESAKPDSHLTNSHSGPKHTSKRPGHNDDMETSCDTAASILVDLHQHVDPQRARAALGCNGSSSCTVSNIKIFQLLDSFPE